MILIFFCPGETSRTPLSPASDGPSSPRGPPLETPLEIEGCDASESEAGEQPPSATSRLQRSKAQSRNTFRGRRSRRNKVEASTFR